MNLPRIDFNSYQFYRLMSVIGFITAGVLGDKTNMHATTIIVGFLSFFCLIHSICREIDASR